MPTIVNGTHYALGNNSSPQNVTIPATGSGNVLVISINTLNGGVTPSATGSAFVSKANLTTPNVWDVEQLYQWYNINAGVTTITLSYGAAQALEGWVFEVSGCQKTVDPWDGISSLQNAFNATNLGCGSITPTQNGLAISIFDDVTGSVPSYTQGAGWTPGTFSAGSYYQYRNSLAGVSVGGNTNQATAPGSNNGQVDGIIFSLESEILSSTDLFFASGDEWHWMGGDWR